MIPSSKLYVLRRRLALRLTLVSASGLGICALTLFAMGASVDVAMRKGWSGVLSGDPVEAGVWTTLGVLLALCAIYLVCVCWATWPAPKGIRLPRKAAPRFFAAMDEIAESLNSPKINRVWINGEMNAVLIQRPAFGWCGPMQTHLMIGLPLVHCVSSEQFRAVLAHELAHLAYQRSGLEGYFAHLRAWWAKVIDTTYESFPWTEAVSQRLSVLFYRDMLRLARLEEFEADRRASEVVGPKLVGDTLIEMGLKGRFLDQDYWPSVFAESLSRPDSELRPYRQMGLGVSLGFLRRESVVEDLSQYEAGQGLLPFHPTLHERLHAIGADLAVPDEATETAADHYFGALLPTIAWALDREWGGESAKAYDADDERHAQRFAEAGFVRPNASPWKRFISSGPSLGRTVQPLPRMLHQSRR